MDTLKEMLKHADDDYLTGLCNKGTVKRAYKDLGQETPAAKWQETEAEVALKEETCVIRMPLGESTCSCPSRSICRHIVTAILWLKQEQAEDAAPEKEEAAAEDTEGSAQKEEKATAEQKNTEKTPKSTPAGEKEQAKPHLLEEILQIPPDRLKRACRGRKFEQFLAHMNAGELPPIEESSIITVTLPWEKATVKLLEPFAYSSCTCHSRELCAHKAQAVLAYQILKGRLSLKELSGLREEESLWDEEQVRRAGKSVLESVLHQMYTGLSRQSPEISASLERLAVITHRAGLPALESRLREAAAEYQKYFTRSAAFRSGTLLGILLWIGQRARELSKAKNQEEIRRLAGSFRDTYEPAGKLHLLGMGGRTFSSRTGYEGEIYYFLEPEKKKWYTWTDARPVFYEGVRRRPPASSENAPAPWGLNCNREQLQYLEFDLMNAKVASGGRLSVSRDSKGEALGSRSLKTEGLREMILWDYEELLLENFGGSEGKAGQEMQNRAEGRREKPVLVGAVRWGETVFDTVEQRFSWNLFDPEGRSLFISLRYTKEERLVIQMLERLEQKLQKHRQEAIVCFGSLYLDEEGRMCLYPIEFLLKGTEYILEDCLLSQKRVSAEEGNREKRLPASMEIIHTMEQYQREAMSQLSDLFVSGISSVQEDTMHRLSVLSEDGERLGLHHAGAEFGQISGLLERKRHQMEFSLEPVLEAEIRLYQYLMACRKKLSCDMALVKQRTADAYI